MSRDVVIRCAYDPGVRRLRRRRPAGEPQVPIEIVEPSVLATDVGPAVVRIGPDRTLLDAPWDMFGCTVANVWPDGRVAGGWARVEWPRDRWSGRSIAPFDLHLGHVLAFTEAESSSRSEWYAIVADVDEHRMVLLRSAAASEAIFAARRAVDVYWASECASSEGVWRERLARLLGREG